MKKQNFYKITTWALLLVNVAMITFFIITSQGPPPPNRNPKMINEARATMKMDETQEAEFMRLANVHKEEMRKINDGQKLALKTYFETLTESQSDFNEEDPMSIILKFEKRKVESTYQHFEDIKGILNPEQYPGFESFTKQALRFILLDQKKDSPPPKK